MYYSLSYRWSPGGYLSQQNSYLSAIVEDPLNVSPIDQIFLEVLLLQDTIKFVVNILDDLLVHLLFLIFFLYFIQINY